MTAECVSVESVFGCFSDGDILSSTSLQYIRSRGRSWIQI